MEGAKFLDVSSLKEIEQAEQKAEEKIQSAKADSEKLLEQMEKEMVDARKKAIEKTKEESAAKVQKARQEAETEQDQMLKEAEEQCAEVIEQAEKNRPQAVQAAIERLIEY